MLATMCAAITLGVWSGLSRNIVVMTLCAVLALAISIIAVSIFDASSSATPVWLVLKLLSAYNIALAILLVSQFIERRTRPMANFVRMRAPAFRK